MQEVEKQQPLVEEGVHTDAGRREVISTLWKESDFLNSKP